ncbi:acyltransferase domain-containing protein [Streptomyces pathocidini]|uniref:ACP S-malonyltransferase n=1 Tax=Streptomyces pathocidini TaxID=1650571 RepID=UPI0033EE7035
MAHRPYIALCPGLGGHDRRLPPDLWPVVGGARAWERADAAAVGCGLKPLSDIAREPEGETENGAVPPGFRGEVFRFVLTVALHEVLSAQGALPQALLGHSFGHQSALTCAGAFTVDDGVRLLVAREEVLRRHAPSGTGMTTLDVGAAQARALLARVADPLLAVACYNCPRRTVVCGPDGSLARVEELARARGGTAIRLPTPYAFHGPALAGAVEPLRAASRSIRQHPLRTPVFSAVTGRFCRDSDDLLGEMAHAVAHPVHFLGAVRELRVGGAETYVDHGLKPMLTPLLRQCDPDAATHHCLDPYHPAPLTVGRVLCDLAGARPNPQGRTG